MKLPPWKTETDDLWLEIKSAYFTLLIRPVSYDKLPPVYPLICYVIDVILTIRSRLFYPRRGWGLISSLVQTWIACEQRFKQIQFRITSKEISHHPIIFDYLPSSLSKLILSSNSNILSKILFLQTTLIPRHPSLNRDLFIPQAPFVTSTAPPPKKFLRNQPTRVFHSKILAAISPFFSFSNGRKGGLEESYLGRNVGRDVLAAGIKLWWAQGSGNTA